MQPLKKRRKTSHNNRNSSTVHVRERSPVKRNKTVSTTIFTLEEDIGHDDEMECITVQPTQPILSTTHHPINNTIRLKVRIEGMTYLVPCDHYHDNSQLATISSLIDKASDRYMIQNGRKPVLNLTNIEGAFLCPTDNIIDVVQEGEVLLGVVTRWESPALADHYQSVCKKLNTGKE